MKPSLTNNTETHLKIFTTILLKSRYAILCLLVFSLMALHTLNAQWAGDFWEHSAVVRELTTHILHPHHPQLLLNAPHAFYSPYTLLVAFMARLFSLDAVTALSIMGLINLGLLFLGIKMFISAMVPEHQDAAAFYTLLLTLFLWGSDAWLFSGFFHIGNLESVLPYPSTFATALSLIALGLYPSQTGSKRKTGLLSIFLISVIILITHPISYIFLVVGLVSQTLASKSFAKSSILWIGGLLGLSLLAAVFWPYFPVLDFFLNEAKVYHSSNFPMYQSVLERTWPNLIALPLITHKIKTNWRHPILLMILVLSVIYLFGAITQNYSYGRVISFIVLLFQILVAEYLSSFEARLREKHPSNWLNQLAVPAVVTFLVVFLSFSPLKTTLDQAFLAPPSTVQPYQFLSEFTGQYDVVLSDIQISWYIPTFGGKVIAVDHPLAFVPDQDIRQSDLERFFDDEATLLEQQQIIEKYEADYLLLSKSNELNQQHLQELFVHDENIVYEDENFILISLKPDS